MKMLPLDFSAEKNGFNVSNEILSLYPYNLFIKLLDVDADTFWHGGYDVQVFLELIRNLSEREQLVLSRRYKDGWTYKEIGEKTLGLSQERIRQIILMAERRLKGRMVHLHMCVSPSADEYYKVLDEYKKLVSRLKKAELTTAKLNAVNLDIGIEEMDFSIRAYHCLKRHGINTLQNIIDFDQNQFIPANGEYNKHERSWKKIRNLGPVCLREIATKVYQCVGYRMHRNVKDENGMILYELIPIEDIDKDA